MKRFLSMLAMAVLVLQSVVTSLAYATDQANPSEESDSVPAVETAVVDEVSDEGSNEGVTAVDDEETVKEFMDADPTSIIYDGIRSNFGMKKVFGLKLAKSAGEPEMTSEEFNKIWNSAEPCDESNPEPFCVLGPKTMSPKKEFNQLDTGDVQIRKLVQRTTNTGEYQISIQVRGKADTTKQNACAVVVFDRSGSMKNAEKKGKECPSGVSCKTESKDVREGNLDQYQNEYVCEFNYISTFGIKHYTCTTFTRTEKKWDNAVEGAKNFAKNLLEEIPNAYIGMVTFSDSVDNSYNRNLIQNTNLDGANFGSPNGGTNIHLGLMTANSMLVAKNECNGDGVQKFIVLISDGAPTHYQEGNTTYYGITTIDGKRYFDDTDYVCHKQGNKESCESGQMKPSKATTDYADSIEGITLLSIGYSVTPDTAAILQDIATKPEYYSNADPVTVAAAFDKILSSIKLAGKGAQLVDDLGAVQLSHGNTGHEIGDITEVGTVVSLKVTIDPDYEGDYQPTNGDVTLTYYNEEGDLQTPITISEEKSAKVYWTPNPCAGDFDEPEEGVIKGGTKTKRAWVENVLTMISPAEWTYNQRAENPSSCEWKCDSDNGYVRDGDKNACKKQTFIIKFVNEDGTELQSESLEYGATPSYKGETPSKAADAQYTYAFAGWDKEIATVTADATYTATYSNAVNSYTIKFVNEDGTELQSESLEYGATPSYKGETPSKAADAQYTYAFAGWDKEIATVTADATYTATYSNAVNSYTIKFVNEDGTELQSESLEYGATPSYKGETPSKQGETGYVYTFSGWNPEIVKVTGDATYTATYTESCDTGYHYEGAEGTTAQVCVSNRTTIGELCSDVTPGEHQVYRGGDENTRIEYNEKEGWNEKYNCGLVCAPQYHEEKQSCVPDEIEVNTVDVCEKLDPANNTHFVKEKQTISYVSGNRQKDCSVTCNDNYHPVKQSDNQEVDNDKIINLDGVIDGTVVINPVANETTEDDRISESDDYMTYKCEIDTFTVTFNSNGGSTVTGQTVEYGKTATQPTTTRNGYNFKEWTLSGVKFDFSTPITGDIILVAQWDKVTNPGGGGGGGSPTYECKNLPANAEANNSNRPSRNTDYTYSEEKDALCTFQCKSGYTRDKENKKCTKSQQPGNGGDDDEDIEFRGQVSDKCSVEGTNRSEEEKAAYLYACENDITTIRDIEKARLGDFLTRAEMAKMISVFATKELGMKPNTSKDCSNFADSIASYNQEMKDFMVMSCQLEIMGIHTTNYEPIPDFMPSKRVSRAEFGTVLSRILWGNKYEGTNDNYYVNHLNALKENNIITNIDPTITEYRAWVFLMLYRSVEAIKLSKATTAEETVEEQVNEELKSETGSTVEVETGAVAETETGSTVEAQTGDTTTTTGDIAKETEVATGDTVETGSTND